MKRILIPTMFAIGSLYLTAGSIQAQTQVLYANVPFAFQTGPEIHKAGVYRIAKDSNLPIVTLRNTKELTTSNLGIVSNAEETKGAPRLTFRRYGSQYFLSEVWGSEKQLRKMPISRAERSVRDGETQTRAEAVSIACKPATGL